MSCIFVYAAVPLVRPSDVKLIVSFTVLNRHESSAIINEEETANIIRKIVK